jgi:hypothetical protein
VFVEQFFTSLSKRQTMLLLTSLAFGGSSSVEAYDHLAVDEEELLKHRAASLLQIPREKRIPLLVQEIKRLVTARRKLLASADPKRMAALLSKERRALVEVVLNALPGDLAQALRQELGNPVVLKLRKDVKPEVLSIIRWKIEDSLKQSTPQVGSFRFTDLLTFQQRDVFAIADRMGARVLATAIAGLNDEARTAWLQKLPPDQKQLAVRAAEAGSSRKLSEKDAQVVLEIHGGIENPSLGMRSAGVQRIVRASLAQSVEFAQRMVERHPGDLGKLFTRWIREEKTKQVKGDGGRTDIVEQMERLAQKSVLDRPMRLPPPMRPPPPVLQPAVERVSSGERQNPPERVSADRPALERSPSRVLSAIPQRRPTASIAKGPSLPAPPNPNSNQPRRDPIAEREARRAGVGRGVVPKAMAPVRGTDSSARIMRDGKPLARKATSPVQAIPKRRVPAGEAPNDTAPQRAPLVKGRPNR